jgi:hypothetical protein
MPSNSYDRFKDHEGKRYTGMKIGRGHKWKYDAGDWSEKKMTPDKWEFQYSVVKRRKGKAPEGSGAPVGTAYRWYILADQIVTKLDANSYTTEMAGVKFKVAHKRADKTSWSASDAAQRKRVVQILREVIADLERSRPAARPEEVPAPMPAAGVRPRGPAARHRNGSRRPARLRGIASRRARRSARRATAAK